MTAAGETEDMTSDERALREAVVAACREMNAAGINQGTSGNVSVRLGERMLITPSAVAYDRMEPDMIASMPVEGGDDAWEGPLEPSSEWRFHRALMAARGDAGAIVHAHPTFATALAMCRREIPACHYMVAAFGGASVRCSGYATFGTGALAELAVEAMEDRTACLLANHGAIVLGESLARAMWRAVELETVARQYVFSLMIGGPVLLSAQAIEDTLKGFSGYGTRPPSPESASKNLSQEPED